jgi:predicted AlkP superfamily pyrophosphatase or phosphodiesterase
MDKVVVINLVALSSKLLGDATPFLKEWSSRKKTVPVRPAFPAVTCTAQSNYLTGKTPSEHGIVGNGWYSHDDCEIKFWKQSNKLVQSEKIWETAKKIDPNFTCANMFWWYNMYSSADISVTPRPQYHADGKKLPDVYSNPSSLRDYLQKKLGTFPLFNFWGPNTSIKSSNWIAEASMLVDGMFNPTLTLIYLPHLDYCLQQYGPEDARSRANLREIDELCKRLITFYERRGAKVNIVSEYSITNVSNPIHINRILREKGYLKLREESGRELLDAGASKAFAVADHQIAHVYINDLSIKEDVKKLLTSSKGIDVVLSGLDKELLNIDHVRAGDLIAVADRDSWFSYYYWLDNLKAPDFARTVEIHKKPGYDPVELFFNPETKLIKARAAFKLLKKKIGFRTLMDFIPLDATLIKGSHGRVPDSMDEWPLLITGEHYKCPDFIESTGVYRVMLDQVFSEVPYLSLPGMGESH